MGGVVLEARARAAGVAHRRSQAGSHRTPADGHAALRAPLLRLLLALLLLAELAAAATAAGPSRRQLPTDGARTTFQRQARMWWAVEWNQWKEAEFALVQSGHVASTTCSCPATIRCCTQATACREQSPLCLFSLAPTLSSPGCPVPCLGQLAPIIAVASVSTSTCRISPPAPRSRRPTPPAGCL